MVYQKQIYLNTNENGHMHRLEDQIQQAVDASRITTGIANVFNVGSTGSICMIEFEPGLQKDLPDILNRLIPPSRSYGHEQMWHDGNGHSHLQASLMGPSLTIPVRDGQLAIGTWQQIIHLECDIKPRKRELIITVYGE